MANIENLDEHVDLVVVEALSHFQQLPDKEKRVFKNIMNKFSIRYDWDIEPSIYEVAFSGNGLERKFQIKISMDYFTARAHDKLFHQLYEKLEHAIKYENTDFENRERITFSEPELLHLDEIHEALHDFYRELVIFTQGYSGRNTHCLGFGIWHKDCEFQPFNHENPEHNRLLNHHLKDRHYHGLGDIKDANGQVNWLKHHHRLAYSYSDAHPEHPNARLGFFAGYLMDNFPKESPEHRASEIISNFVQLNKILADAMSCNPETIEASLCTVVRLSIKMSKEMSELKNVLKYSDHIMQGMLSKEAAKKRGAGGGGSSSNRKHKNLELLMAEIEGLKDSVGTFADDAILAQAWTNASEKSKRFPTTENIKKDYFVRLKCDEPYIKRYAAVFGT